MATLSTGKLLAQRTPYFLQFVRNKWINKIKHDVYPSLQERLEEQDETRKDPELHAPINIGFSRDKGTRRNVLFDRLETVKRNKRDAKLEKLAKNRLLKVDLDVVQEEWQGTDAPGQVKVLADHYGIFKDLFGNAFFYPYVYLNVSYDYDEDTESIVHRGNTIKPCEATTPPNVKFSSKPDDMWTLVLTNPDGNLYENESECLHWFVGNIPGGDVSKGEVVCDYLQPFPPRGSGYHRMVFLLFKQEGRIDFSKYQRQNQCLQLQDRTFSTLEFYRGLQDEMTPAGISWFQSDWDSSLTDFFHHKLNMQEPVFEYDFPEPYLKPERFFPIKKQFNTYMDRYRDQKEINKEILLKRLKNLNPLEPEPPILRFPAAVPLGNVLTSWERKELKKERIGEGKYRDLYRGRNRPAAIMVERIKKFEVEYEGDSNKTKRYKYGTKF